MVELLLPQYERNAGRRLDYEGLDLFGVVVKNDLLLELLAKADRAVVLRYIRREVGLAHEKVEDSLRSHLARVSYEQALAVVVQVHEVEKVGVHLVVSQLELKEIVFDSELLDEYLRRSQLDQQVVFGDLGQNIVGSFEVVRVPQQRQERDQRRHIRGLLAFRRGVVI